MTPHLSSITSIASSLADALRQLAPRLHRLGSRPLYQLMCRVVGGSSSPLGIALKLMPRSTPKHSTLSVVAICRRPFTSSRNNQEPVDAAHKATPPDD